MTDNLIFNTSSFFEENQESNKIHIRIKQRNGRKSITTIENLPLDVDLTDLSKKMKKTFHCISTVVKSDNEKILQLSGDQRIVAKKFLVDNNIGTENSVITHGY